MERAYREDELLGATIIDSEGYVYGRVEKVSVDEGEIVLLASEDKPDVKTVVDVNRVKEGLIKEVKTTFGSRLRRMTPWDILAENIRSELGIGATEQLSDEHYLKYAERMGFYIPHVKATVGRKEQKGTVSLNEIKTIKITVMGKEKGTNVIKVVLLREPREAAFRGISIQAEVQYRSTEVIRDKLVLDTEGNALGYVDSLVLFPNTPGIRVYVSKVGRLVNLISLTKYLEDSHKSDVAALIRRHFIDQPKSHRYQVPPEELEDFMVQMKLTFMLPEQAMVVQGAREFVADIPWDEIHKIGDAVLLKSTLTDLRSKGYI